MTQGSTVATRHGVSRSGRPYVIRCSTPSDCAAFVELLNDVAAERSWLIANPGNTSMLEETVALASILGTGGMSLTLDVDGVVVGRVVVQTGRPPLEDHVGDLAIIVAAPYRDDGMGRALVDAAVGWSRASGLARLALKVFPSNARAIAVYRAAGFSDEGVTRRAIRMPEGYRDLLVMSVLP